MPILEEIYRGYLDCLNRQDWNSLGDFVEEKVEHNGLLLGLSGYHAMLVKDFIDIPDLFFQAEFLVSEHARIGARLRFVCSPRADFMGLPVNGKRVTFCEHVFYEFAGSRISKVWSIIDKSAIERQL